MKIRNAKWLDDTRIDCEIEHPEYGWIPFTAGVNDVEEHGRAIFHAAAEVAVSTNQQSE